jgi:integrase/recombinase XerC
MRRLFSFLLRRGLIVVNPANGVRAPKVRRRLPQVLDVDQTVRLVSVEPDDFLACRDRALLELTYSSGLRVSEVVGLNVDALDLEQGEARVLGKGKKFRVVPVGRQAVLALRHWLDLRQLIKDVDAQAVFVSRTGNRLTTRAVQLRCARWGLLQGLETHVHPHLLRHSFASHVLESSGDLRAVQELLGHADIRSTQVYTHLDFQHLAKVYDAAHPRARRRRDDQD